MFRIRLHIDWRLLYYEQTVILKMMGQVILFCRKSGAVIQTTVQYMFWLNWLESVYWTQLSEFQQSIMQKNSDLCVYFNHYLYLLYYGHI